MLEEKRNEASIVVVRALLRKRRKGGNSCDLLGALTGRPGFSTRFTLTMEEVMHKFQKISTQKVEEEKGKVAEQIAGRMYDAALRSFAVDGYDVTERKLNLYGIDVSPELLSAAAGLIKASADIVVEYIDSDDLHNPEVRFFRNRDAFREDRAQQSEFRRQERQDKKLRSERNWKRLKHASLLVVFTISHSIPWKSVFDFVVTELQKASIL